MKKLLVAFDFDHTIIDVNSDIEIRRLVNQSKIPEKVKHLYKNDGWTCYMREIFLILHKNKISKEQILHECQMFRATEGMIELIKYLKDVCHADIIIISDSNSVFIKEWLQSVNLDKYIAKVFTNPASFNKNGLLEIDMYHEQSWCKLSTKNLCKGHILENYIKETKNYDVVGYVGDGKNDLCPSLKLGEKDVLFPRVGYNLLSIINNGRGSDIKAKVFPWKSGYDILEVFQQNGVSSGN